MSEWFETLDGLHAQVWSTLARGAADPEAPSREVVLATCGGDGAPQARTLVLRAARRAEGIVELQTDRASAKVAELAAEPRAALLARDPALRLQIRLSLAVVVLTGPELDPVWQALPEAARVNYGGVPAPGRPLARAEAYRETAERARFALLRGTVTAIEALHLGALHRRAGFDGAGAASGRWIGP